MRTLVFLLMLAAACGSGDVDPSVECGPNRPCPMGYSCSSVGRCTLSNETDVPDARPDAASLDARPDAASPPPDSPLIETTILTAPAARAAAALARFTFSGVGATAFVCTVDGAAAAPCTSPFEVTVAEGTHTFSVAAVGDSTPAVASWTVDLTPPDTQVSGPTGTVNTTDATFRLTATEEATFECRLDGAAFAACTTPAHFSGLAVGDHVFAARATDTVGHVDPTPAEARWTIDVTGPIIIVAGTPEDQSSTNDPAGHFTLSFADAGDADGGTFECGIDGGPPAACTSPVTVTFGEDGPHAFGVRGRDRIGNVGPLVKRTFTLDRVAPGVKIGGTPADGALTSQRRLALQPAFVDAGELQRGSILTCSLDGAAFTAEACTTGATASLTTDGPHSFKVKGRDLAGNEAQAARSFTLDTTAPVATLTGPPDDGSVTQNRSTTFTFSLDAGAGAGAVTECQLIGPGVAEPFAAAGCHDRSNLPDGAYRFSVRGRDVAGNVGAPATIAWTIDNQGPSVAFLASSTPPDGAQTRSPTVAYAWTFTDPADAAGGHLQFSLDGTSWTTSADGTFAGDLDTEGTNTFSARGVDALGNAGPPVVRTMVLDTQKPIVTLTGTPTNGQFTKSATTSLTWTFVPEEPASTIFECSIDGDPTFAAANCENRTYADGAHSFAVQGRDAAGNTSDTKSVAFTVDTVQPTAHIDSSDPANGAVSNNRRWRLTFSSNESNVTFECRFNGVTTIQACTSLNPFPQFDGQNTVVVRATDLAGNIGPFSNQVGYTLDTTGPQLINIMKPNGHSTPRVVTVSWSAGEPVASYTCTFIHVDNKVECGGGSATVMEISGSNNLDVIATDGLGNVSSTAIVWTVN